jgi:hypothetical protein
VLAGRRFAVFESVRGYLADAAADTGLVLMFDDVHWADAPSLRLLRHLSTGLGAARLLLLITYRDTETVGRDELTAFLAALAREEAVRDVRETAQLELPTAERLAVHARMGSYLRGHPLRGQADAVPAVIAHHLLESLPAGDAIEATLWAERAASAAMSQLAWEDAAVFYARAVRAWPGPGPADRCRRLCGLALARLRGFDLEGGSSTLREAAEADAGRRLHVRRRDG